jgi:hypothetical protein
MKEFFEYMIFDASWWFFDEAVMKEFFEYMISDASWWLYGLLYAIEIPILAYGVACMWRDFD